MKSLQEFEKLLNDELLATRKYRQLPPEDIAAGGLVMLSQAIESSKLDQKFRNRMKLYGVLYFLTRTEKVDALEEVSTLESFEGFGEPDPLVLTFEEAKRILMRTTPADIDFQLLAATVCVMLKVIEKPGNLSSESHLHLKEKFADLEFLLED